MDLQLGRLKAAIEKAGGNLCLTADHGNSDDMYEHKKDGSVAMGAEGGRFFILKYLTDYSIFSSSSFTLHCKNKTSTPAFFASFRACPNSGWVSIFGKTVFTPGT